MDIYTLYNIHIYIYIWIHFPIWLSIYMVPVMAPCGVRTSRARLSWRTVLNYLPSLSTSVCLPQSDTTAKIHLLVS